MRITIAAPFSSAIFAELTGLRLANSPAGQGGVPSTTLAAELFLRGHEVTVVTLAEDVKEPQQVNFNGGRIIFCPIRSGPNHRARERALDLFQREITSMTRALQSAPSDIIHAHWTYEYAEAALRSGKPHLVTMHDLGWECLWQFRDAYRLMRLLMKYRVMHRVKHLSVVSPYMASKARYYGYFGPIEVIPNPVALPDRHESLPSLRHLTRPKIVTIGNLSSLKNVGASVSAFREVQRRIPASELHLFGPGLAPPYAADTLNVVAHGEQPHSVLMDFLRSEASLLVHPSRLESFGMAIVEAKARGVPVVAGASSGATRYVCDDPVSALVDIEDPLAIATAVLKLLSGQASYDCARRISSDDVKRRFSSETVASMYEAAYERAASAQ